MTPDNPDRPRRPGGPGRPGGAGRGSGGGRPERPGRPDRAGSGRPARPRPGDERPRPSRAGGSSDRDGRGGPRRDRPERAGEDTEPRPVFPPINSDVEAAMLDRQARRELSGLGKEDAEFVAKHLVMASLVIDDDPALAHEHAKAALHKGSRIPVVRETMGITAYVTGDYALCVRELRTHRRLSGQNTQLPMMVDAERGLGRPERGIEVARGVERTGMPDQWVVELAIALSGCRLDLGQTDQALVELQIPQLNPTVAYSYSPDLFDAYAVVLEDSGRAEEAALWGQRAQVAAAALSERTWSDNDGVGDIVDTLAEGESEGDTAAPETVQLSEPLPEGLAEAWADPLPTQESDPAPLPIPPQVEVTGGHAGEVTDNLGGELGGAGIDQHSPDSSVKFDGLRGEEK